MDPWTIPTAGYQAYEHREEIAAGWERVLAALVGEKATIAVTGMPGVGKTVLLDQLTGKGLKDTYRPPGKSLTMEKYKRRGHRLRMFFRTVPGQESPVRIQSLNNLFNAKKPVTGLIHVVANGFSHVRSDFARAQLEEQMDLNDYRELQHAAEITDLTSTLAFVRGAMVKQKKPFWVIVAVNKADLFATEAAMENARSRYEGPGTFVAALEDFKSQVGADNVQWEAYPVSSWSESFQWRASDVRPGLDRPQQLQLISRLRIAIEQHVLASKT